MKNINETVKSKYLIYILFLAGGLLLGWLLFHNSDTDSHTSQASETGTVVHDPTHGHDLQQNEAGEWTCSMHPQIRQDKPGKCPICAMDLIPVRKSSFSDKAIDPNAIQLSEEAAALADVQTSKVSRQNPVKQVRLYGKIVPDERSLQSQTAHVSGRIESLNVDFTGETVRAGQTLATLYSPELFTAQQELLEAIRMGQSQLIQAAREKLYLWKMTDAQIAAIEKSGSISPVVEIKSNTSGIVLSKRVSQGDYVSQGAILFDVANLTKVWALFDAFEVDLPFLSKGDPVEFTLQALPGKKMYATANVSAPLRNYKNEIVVPQTAVLWTGKRAIVYVKQPDTNTPAFLMREVELGPSLGNSYVILNGLREGEEIVTNGVFAIDASAQLEGKTSMMNNGDEPAKPMIGHEGHMMHAQSATGVASEHAMFGVKGSCDMCKERIEKAAKEVNGVLSAHWDKDTQMIHLQYDPQKTSPKAISKAIAKVGHDTDMDKADKAVYDKLPACCHYR